jgi:hypothetical protein
MRGKRNASELTSVLLSVAVYTQAVNPLPMPAANFKSFNIISLLSLLPRKDAASFSLFHFLVLGR